MPTLEQIQGQIKALGYVEIFSTKKEIKYLPELLDEAESVLAITSGFMDGNTWIVVCTEKRVIFLDKGLIYGLKQVEIPLDKINSIGQKTGMMFGSISIWDGASRMEIQNVPKATVQQFVSEVNRARDTIKARASANSGGAVQAGFDVASQLERLAALRDKGVLSDEEFQAQKKKILGM